MYTSLSATMPLVGTCSPKTPYELLMRSARWLSTMSIMALRMSLPPLLAAPQYTIDAPGAIACTAWTSSVCSPYHPC